MGAVTNHYSVSDFAGSRRILPRPTRPLRTTEIATAAAALVLSCPVLVWAAMSPNRADGVDPAQLDYAYRAPAVPHALGLTVAVLALTVALVSGGVLRMAYREADRLRRGRWVGLLWCFLLAGAFVAQLGRTLTYGGIGANIGAGLELAAAPFVLTPLALVALWIAAGLARER